MALAIIAAVYRQYQYRHNLGMECKLFHIIEMGDVQAYSAFLHALLFNKVLPDSSLVEELLINELVDPVRSSAS